MAHSTVAIGSEEADWQWARCPDLVQPRVPPRAGQVRGESNPNSDDFFLIWQIRHAATISRDRFGMLIAVGVATIFLFHVFISVGMTMGIMPVTASHCLSLATCVAASWRGQHHLLVPVQSIAMRSRSEVSKHPKV